MGQKHCLAIKMDVNTTLMCYESVPLYNAILWLNKMLLLGQLSVKIANLNTEDWSEKKLY